MRRNFLFFLLIGLLCRSVYSIPVTTENNSAASENAEDAGDNEEVESGDSEGSGNAENRDIDGSGNAEDTEDVDEEENANKKKEDTSKKDEVKDNEDEVEENEGDSNQATEKESQQVEEENANQSEQVDSNSNGKETSKKEGVPASNIIEDEDDEEATVEENNEDDSHKRSALNKRDGDFDHGGEEGHHEHEHEHQHHGHHHGFVHEWGEEEGGMHHGHEGHGHHQHEHEHEHDHEHEHEGHGGHGGGGMGGYGGGGYGGHGGGGGGYGGGGGGYGGHGGGGMGGYGGGGYGGHGGGGGGYGGHGGGHGGCGGGYGWGKRALPAKPVAFHCRDMVSKSGKHEKHLSKRFCVPIGHYGGYGWPYWHGYPGVGTGLYGWGWPWHKSKVAKNGESEKVETPEDKEKNKSKNKQRDSIERASKKQTVHVGYGYASGDNYRLGYQAGGMGGLASAFSGRVEPDHGFDEHGQNHFKRSMNSIGSKRQGGPGFENNGPFAQHGEGGNPQPYGHPVTHPGFTTMGFPGHALASADVRNKINHPKVKRQAFEPEPFQRGNGMFQPIQMDQSQGAPGFPGMMQSQSPEQEGSQMGMSPETMAGYGN